MEESITKDDITALEELISLFENWNNKYNSVAKKFKMGNKIAGFLGEAIAFREISHLGIDSAWVGGTHKGYDIKLNGKEIMINVKTANNALRYKGRGADKKPDHYEWSVGWSSAEEAKTYGNKLVFIFVDLKNFESKPDFYIVPSVVIEKYFLPNGIRDSTWPWARWHPELSEIQPYKGAWTNLD